MNRKEASCAAAEAITYNPDGHGQQDPRLVERRKKTAPLNLQKQSQQICKSGLSLNRASASVETYPKADLVITSPEKGLS